MKKSPNLKITVLNAVDCKVEKKYYDDVWDCLAYPVEVDSFGKRETIYRSFLDRRGGKFATGLLPIVTHKMKEKGYKVKVEHCFYKNLKPNADIPSLTVTLEPYQRRPLRKVEKHNRGLIIAPTAAGKTIIEAAIISAFGMPKTLVIVPNRDLFYQTAAKFKELLDINKVGLLGDGKREVEDITIALYQTLINYKLDKVNKTFDMLLIDEVQTSRCESYQIILNQLTDIHYRYGFTGTMRLKQPDRYIIQGLLGKPLTVISEGTAGRRVTDVKMYMIRYEGKLEWYSRYHDRVVENIWLNEERNRLIADIVNYFVKDKNMSCLVLVEKHQQADAIRYQIIRHRLTAPILWNKTSNEDRERYKEMLDRKELMCLIATPAISVGSDIPNVECVIIGSEVKHWLSLTQKIGRGRRKTEGKRILYAVDIFSVFGKRDKNFLRQSRQKAKVYRHKGWLQGVYSFDKFKEEMRNENNAR